jgi:hypothetical protein
LVFEDDDGVEPAPLVAAAEDFIPLPEVDVEEDGEADGVFLPIVDADEFLAAPGQLNGSSASDEPGDAEDLAEPVRPDHVDVYMPFVDLRHFDHVAYAFINPSSVPAVHDPDSFILQAADLACGPDRVSLFPSAASSRVAVFVSDGDREQAVANGPFLGREASVYFRRHDETDQRFLFDHEAMAALSISRFPFEHWQRHHITHSSGPYANPHNIDPICLTGVDFQAVLVTVKAESIKDIPLNLAVKNYCSLGTLSQVTIIDFDDLSQGSDHSSGPDLEDIPDAASSAEEEDELVDLPGGTAYPEMMEMLGVPPPLVPHGAPHSAAPAASIVARALASAPPLPSVEGGPILSKPTSVHVKLRLGFFDVTVTGSAGEQAFFRLPLRKAAPSTGCKGLLVANFVTASVGLVDSIALVGPLRRPVLSVDVLVRSAAAPGGECVSLEAASALVSGCSDPSLEPSLLGEPRLITPSSPKSPALLLRDSEVEAGAEVAGMTALPALPSPVRALAAEAAPVSGTLWPAASPARQPRRCSRLARDCYVSIVDKAIARKKELFDGSTAASSRRRGELVPDDLFAVAMEDGGPLADEDVEVLARACDISLGVAQDVPTVLPASP